MWVFLNNSFLSIVADKENANRILVRARKKGDIQAAFKGLGVKLKVGAGWFSH